MAKPVGGAAATSMPRAATIFLAATLHSTVCHSEGRQLRRPTTSTAYLSLAVVQAPALLQVSSIMPSRCRTSRTQVARLYLTGPVLEQLVTLTWRSITLVGAGMPMVARKGCVHPLPLHIFDATRSSLLQPDLDGNTVGLYACAFRLIVPSIASIGR